MGSVNQSTLKALDVLEILATAEDGLRITDLAKRAGFPASTTHRLLLSLSERGYVEQDLNSGRYYLGIRILSLQTRGIRHRPLSRQALPHLSALRHQLNETVNLGVRSEQNVLCLESLIPDTLFAFHASPGTLMPLHCTAMGKVLLANFPSSTRESLVSTLELKAFTPHTITRLQDLERELQEVCQRGYAVDNQEYNLVTRSGDSARNT